MINDLVASVLAAQIGLPVAVTGIVEATEEFIGRNHLQHNGGGNTWDWPIGLQLGSQTPADPDKQAKIDKAFISELQPGSNRIEVVRAMVAVARSLNMDTVAEGVETPRQAALAAELGCDYLQGFFFSKPLHLRAVEKLLSEGMFGGYAAVPTVEAAV